MTNLQKTFTVTSVGAAGISTPWLNRLKDKECDDLVMAIPPEFGGPGETYSPEDLYALSLMNCYFATFKYIAEKSKLTYDTLTGEATLNVGKGDRNALWMESIVIAINVIGCPNKERALKMLESTKTQCMIINSVNTKVEFKFNVEE